MTGTVSEDSHKALAQENAADYPEVTREENKLTTKAEAATENADWGIARKVKLVLLFHRDVNAGGTEVTVDNGVVTLNGEATSLVQKI